MIILYENATSKAWWKRANQKSRFWKAQAMSKDCVSDLEVVKAPQKIHFGDGFEIFEAVGLMSNISAPKCAPK